MSGKNGYFACPLASGRNRKLALDIVEYIESFGLKILDRHVVAEEGKGMEEFCRNSGISPENFNSETVRKQDLEWLRLVDFMVLDYSNGSWGGGIEFDQATVVRKLLGLQPIPILCLRSADTIPSWLVLGIDPEEFPKVWLKEYRSFFEIKLIITDFLAYFSLI